MASGTYNTFRTKIMQKSIDMVNDTIKVCLLTSSYTFNPDHTTYASLTNEVSSSGTGYTTGGTNLAGTKSVTQNDTTDTGVFTTSAQHDFAGLTCSVQYAVLYDSTVSNALIACVDLGAQSLTAATLSLVWSGTGIITIA